MRSSTLSGVGIFLFYKGKLLLNLRDDIPDISYPATWALIGGAIDAGDETMAAAADRELHEELGIKVTVSSFFRIYEDPTCKMFFKGTLSDEDVSKINLQEGMAYAFFNFDGLLALHRLGKAKGGLGGALGYYFMENESAMVLDMFAQYTYCT